MKVILLKSVHKLGRAGDVVEVKDGYGRNYLIPEGMALRATVANLRLVDIRKEEILHNNQQAFERALALREQYSNIVAKFVMHGGDDGRLFGSVTTKMIANAMNEKIGKDAIPHTGVMLQSPIKARGIYTVEVCLHPEVTFNVTVNVARSDTEASDALNAYLAEVAAPIQQNEEEA